VCDGIWLFTFMDYDLGYFDPETRVPEPLEYAFSSERYPCLRSVLLPMSQGWTLVSGLRHR
jgi:hypothetical protein